HDHQDHGEHDDRPQQYTHDYQPPSDFIPYVHVGERGIFKHKKTQVSSYPGDLRGLHAPHNDVSGGAAYVLRQGNTAHMGVIPRAPAAGVNRHRCPEVVPKLLQLLDQFPVGPRLPVAPAVVGVQPAVPAAAPKLGTMEILGQLHRHRSPPSRSLASASRIRAGMGTPISAKFSVMEIASLPM